MDTPTYSERGAGAPVLLLHGGAGPMSVTDYADRLAAGHPYRVITPTHPGFDGTPRPDSLTTVGGLADVYVSLLDALDLTGVTVVGNSIGGWIAAEIGIRRSPRVDRLVLVDAVGLEVPGHPVAGTFGLTLPELADLSYHDPDRFRIDPSVLPPAARAAMAGNRAALTLYAPSMVDATLRDRLPAIGVPTLVVWGDADRIVSPEYGRAYADAIPGARFEVLPKTGHLPQLESPDLFTDVLAGFVGR
ncbi:alpha/beta fold hydrolase [Cryptosporangium sp. NPDC051539]|uniref:alpha/beta fold hydrolase n=1 Tax=Cryptosporangium sp. NPDC051539 TaxID=3363962 RepID=UPI00379CFD03